MTKKDYENIANMISHVVRARNPDYFTDAEVYRMIGIIVYDLGNDPRFNPIKFETYLSEKLKRWGYDLDEGRECFRDKIIETEEG